MASITNSTDMNLGKLWEIVEDKKRLVCCSPWGHKELEMTELLDGTELIVNLQCCINFRCLFAVLSRSVMFDSLLLHGL